MPDKRQHRGAHPADARLFGPQAQPALREATADLCWLLNRGYATNSALKLVGDRYDLTKRQRIAVSRCACSDREARDRQGRRVDLHLLADRELWIDGYNVLTSIEAALAGGVILKARDGTYRDMASVHGTYRTVEETRPALQLIGRFLQASGAGLCRWFLDSPVSNSGRLKTLMQQVAAEAGWNWHIELATNPDRILSETSQIIASSDSAVLDGCCQWVNLARALIEHSIPQPFLADLSARPKDAEEP